MFATRADLLERNNASRLAQLAVPADRSMPDVAAIRAAINGDDLLDYTPEDQETLSLALAAIDKALLDANELIVSYGIPVDLQTSVLARLGATIAFYYLQNTAVMTDAVQKAYDGAIDILKSHAKGTLNLIPDIVTDPPTVLTDGIEIFASPSRYRDVPSEEGWID